MESAISRVSCCDRKTRQKASEIYEANKEQAKHLREQAREAIKRCEVLRQEIKRSQVKS